MYAVWEKDQQRQPGCKWESRARVARGATQMGTIKVVAKEGKANCYMPHAVLVIRLPDAA